MNIRETMEQWERQNLSPYASLSSETLGRDREEPLCDIRPAYQRDRDRILHSKSFRRLKDKTQVFLAPEGDQLPDETDPYVRGIPDRENDRKGTPDE